MYIAWHRIVHVKVISNDKMRTAVKSFRKICIQNTYVFTLISDFNLDLCETHQINDYRTILYETMLTWSHIAGQ